MILPPTKVADMPGYPTRKLLFGGPETLTKAVILSSTYKHHRADSRRDDMVLSTAQEESLATERS